ncbi:MAG TPA: AAA family ATPase [Actinomycetota bacterium]|nr:AAA family ATPase [Actinomycetota bacterium]
MSGTRLHPPTRLLGRSRELELITGQLDATLQGLAGFVVLEGEAGVGKSRLLSEASLRAREMNFCVVETRAYELEHARPFGPLVSVIPGAGGMGGFQLQEHVVAHLEESALARPVLLTLDDAHWSDVSTLGALAACVRRLSHLPFLALVAARPLPRPPELDRLTSQADLVAVQPLDEEAVAQMVWNLLGAAPGPTLRKAVEGAAGNPFLIGELVEGLRADGALDVRAGVADTPGPAVPSLRMSVLRRMSMMRPATLDTMRLASVLGSTFTVSDLSAVSRKPVTDLLPCIAEAVRAGVLEERDEELRFRHDLLREALYEDMPLSSRIALHLDCARTLASTGATAERVAPHFSLGATVGDTEAVEWLIRAGDEASPRDPSAALQLYERARDLLRHDDPSRVGLSVKWSTPCTGSGAPTRSCRWLPRRSRQRARTKNASWLPPSLLHC